MTVTKYKILADLVLNKAETDEDGGPTRETGALLDILQALDAWDESAGAGQEIFEIITNEYVAYEFPKEGN